MMTFKTQGIALVLALLAPAFAAAEDFQPEITPAFARAQSLIRNFREVTPGIYRGALPDSPEAIQALKDLGIKTDISLMEPGSESAWEKIEATRVGLHFIHRPMSSFRRIEDAEIENTLNILRDTSNFPIFFHCKHGEDRTGMMAGFYRVFVQGWTPNDAYTEMKNYNFHSFLTGVNCTFREKTGLEVPFFCGSIPHYHPFYE